MRNTILAALVAACTAMAGCSTLGTVKDGVQELPAVQLAVKYAVLKATKGEAAYAVAIVNGIDRLISYAETDESAAVDQLANRARELVSESDWEPEDKWLVNEAITAAQARLNELVDEGRVSSDARVKVLAFLRELRTVAQYVAVQ